MGNNPSVLLIDKQPGLTSFASLYPVKRHVDRKVGHAGTLDKFAQGLMIVLTGAMTRLNPLFSNMDKEYVATIRFGEETDTLDPEGEVIATGPIPTLDTIRHVIEASFLGELQQYPPAYSALHIDGQRAYTLARKGKEVQMPLRDITIYSFEVMGWNPPDLQARIRVSKGTYIRSIARDLAHACGTFGRLETLQRTSIGPYRLEEAVDPDDTDKLRTSVGNTPHLLSLLPGCCSMTLAQVALFPLSNGTMPKSDQVVSSTYAPGDGYALLYGPMEDRLLAVASLKTDGTIQRVVAHIDRQGGHDDNA